MKRNVFKVCFYTFELGTELKDEFPVSRGRKFQSRGPIKRKPFCQVMILHMKRTSESEDRLQTECEGNERIISKICWLMTC